MISNKDLKKIKNLKRPLVFIPMAVDLIHFGHIRILNKSKKLGTVIVGLMTDKGLQSYKGKPFMSYKHRKEIITELKSVDYVIPLNGLKYLQICNVLKPNYFVHGTDWKNGIQSKKRDQLIKEQKLWGGKVKEFTSTKNVSSTKLKNLFK